MITETTPRTEIATMGLSPGEAFVSLLVASARADGTVSPHEANQIEHVAAGMKLFRGSSFEARNRIFQAAADRLKEQGTEDVVRAAAVAIPPELGATAFAAVVDLMLSDGGLTASELRFAETLPALLNVNPEMAARILEVLAIKNAG